MTKKLLSLLLSVLMILSAFGTVSAFAEDNETEILGPGVEENTLPEVAEGCNRYYFYMPEFWKNEYSVSAGIYWWEGTGAQSSWPGVKANKADAENVYYYDVPKDVDKIIWNNYMNLSFEEYEAFSYMNMQTCNINAASYATDDSDTYPNGLESFDGMIYVLSGIYASYDKMVWSGEWYYYYGNGEYGITPVRGDGSVYTDEIVPKEDYILPPYLGDADGNGVVNIKDATHLQKLIAGIDVEDVSVLVGDVDDSGEINIKDANVIQKCIAGIDTGFKVGEYVLY